MKLSLKLLIKIIIVFTAFTISAAPVTIKSRSAVVTFAEGDVFIVPKGKTDKKVLKKGDSVSEGDKVMTASDSRIEIKLLDKSIVRFDEDSSFILESARIVQKKRSISIKLILGKAWANVTKLFGKKKGGFKISSNTVVAGVRGTVYRMNVKKDYASIVKVYSGEVWCKNPPKRKSNALFAPTPVKGPHPVSMKEWVVILKSMQTVVISSDGKIDKPVSFSEKEDTNTWVKWNKEKDKKITQ